MTSTTRSTAGPGFDFEDQVAAWVMLNVLHGEPLWGSTRHGTRIQMQVKALGWWIDDILVTTGTAPHDHQFRALSCKSSVQVTAEKLPSEFIAACWQQWFERTSNPFRKEKDGFVLVTRGRNNDFMATWTELKTHAKGDDPLLTLARIQQTNKFQTMFSSVKSPAKDAGFDVGDQDVLALIRAINVLPFDLQIVESQTEHVAIERSRLLLTAGSIDDGRNLWLELIDAARVTRLGSGTLDRAELLTLLRGRFSLRDHPDYSKSWAALRALSAENRALIETTLSSGLAIDRDDEAATLLERLFAATVSVVFGDSGSGKSALLKAVVDSAFADAEQVWVGPSDTHTLLNQVTRVAAGLDQQLLETLRQSAARVVLVIDAAERISPEGVVKVKSLIRDFQATSDETGCRIVIVGHTDAWVDGRLQDLAGSATPAAHEVKALSVETVRYVLRATSGLAPLALDDGTVLALTNIRTLSWVVQAASRFQTAPGSSTLSVTTIADRLWSYWTDSKASVQRLLMRLAEREATFEHSFAISEFDAGDVSAFDERPIHCPLKRDPSTGRVRFAHDLASEWARFQKLRELSYDVSRWQVYAGNPFWHGPIRMLGQHLLRVREGERSAWEVALEAAEQNRKSAPLADDLLLDALFLDPDAESLLDRQADLLFANDGERLLRLIRRFEHIASEPRARPAHNSRFSELSLYLETELRAPIYGRWPPMARFLSRHRDRAAALMSPQIAKICERWLANTPLTLSDGQPTPYRAEFARLALACAREAQTALAKGDILGLHDEAKSIFHAALAAGHDLPAEIYNWALEMAERRPTDVDVVKRVAAHHGQRAAEHARRMETDAEYRKRHEQLKRLPHHIPSGRRLPPWPLGPKHAMERSFRESALSTGALSALMRSEPDAASEVLLACIIEDEPVEEYQSRMDLDRELGIEYDQGSYPTAPWKSPFLLFLGVNPRVALPTLIRLVDFATERWSHAVRGEDTNAPPAHLVLNLNNEAPRQYVGYADVFNWSHDNSTFIGQLHSALAALESWLCDVSAADSAQSEYIELALRTSHSSAVVGVLSNLAKHDPTLLRGSLRCLAGSQHVHRWDAHRVDVDRFAADLAYWARSGEMMFEMAKRWLSRPYRQTVFTDVVCRLLAFDETFGAFILSEIANWIPPEPDDKKSVVEFALLRARLDYRNYQAQQDSESETPSRMFVCPPDVVATVRAFQSDNSLALQVLSLPDRCRGRLMNPEPLQPAETEHLAAVLAAIDTDTKLDLDENAKARARIAVACVLVLRAAEWLVQNPSIDEQVGRLIQREVDATWDAPLEGNRRSQGTVGALQLVAWVAVEKWAQKSSRAAGAMVLKVLMSGDEIAVQTLSFVSVTHKTALGLRWWRLLYIALIWSGLLVLKPRYGDDDAYANRWRRWRRWLAGRDLSVGANIETFKPIQVAEAVGRIDGRRERRRGRFHGPIESQQPTVPRHGGLHDGVLEPVFSWLTESSPNPGATTVTLTEQEALLRALWEHQAWRLRGSAKEGGEFQLTGRFGYEIVARLASISHQVSAEKASGVWKPILALGAHGHYLISHFLSSWFLQLSESTSANDLTHRWRTLIEFVLKDATWLLSAPWYHRESLTRAALGLHFPDAVVRVPGHSSVIESMKDLYRIWAEHYLAGDEDNLSEFCYFLAHEAGKPLRLEGLAWIVGAKASKPEFGNWFRGHTGSNLVDFLNMLVGEQREALRSNQSAKTALLELATLAEAKQLKAAMPLLERIRRL